MGVSLKRKRDRKGGNEYYNATKKLLIYFVISIICFIFASVKRFKIWQKFRQQPSDWFKNGEYPLYIVVCYGGRVEKVNREIVRRNVENEHKDDITLIDLECRYYSYRHSYLMAQIQKPNVNLLKLATVTGKALTSLHQYLSYLNDLDLVE